MATKTLYEVVIEADEPWHDGLRQRVADAVMAFTDAESQPQQHVDFDEVLASFVQEYEGYGMNAHANADQFVFSSGSRAQAFADELRDHVEHEAAIRVFTIEDEAADGDDEGD